MNGIFGDGIGGGDVHFFHMVRAAAKAGRKVCLFGGDALKRRVQAQQISTDLIFTECQDQRADTGPSGQMQILVGMIRRMLGALARLRSVRRDDIAYSMSDYWFDTIPLILCGAQRKILFLGMMAPTLKQIVLRERADVTASRVSSLYYWLSQQLSLRWFRRCKSGIVAYGHPEIRDYLRNFGYHESDLRLLPFACDVGVADRVPAQSKMFDVVWTGRAHPQKNIPDLLATLKHLAMRLPDFSALIIGDVRAELEPKITEMGLAGNVTFSGLVADVETKFVLLKRSRVFVMPSCYESWGIVVGEALTSGVPVVAYQLDCYEPLFGEAVRYVEPFDREMFMRTVEDEVRNQRAGVNYLTDAMVARLNQRLRWESVQEQFVRLLSEGQSY